MTTVDIRNAAAQKLSTGFPEFSQYFDVMPHDFSKPCFLVQINPVSKINESSFQFTKTVSVNIKYYPEEGAGIGLLEMQDQLEELFDMVLQVGDRTLGIDGTKGEIIEKLLHFNFELSFTGSREDMESNLDKMQTLEMKEEF